MKLTLLYYVCHYLLHIASSLMSMPSAWHIAPKHCLWMKQQAQFSLGSDPFLFPYCWIGSLLKLTIMITQTGILSDSSHYRHCLVAPTCFKLRGFVDAVQTMTKKDGRCPSQFSTIPRIMIRVCGSCARELIRADICSYLVHCTAELLVYSCLSQI